MDPFTIWLTSFGVGALIGLLTVIALRISAWVVDVAIKGIIGLIKRIKAHVAVVRKRKKLLKFIELAMKSGNPEMAEELDSIRRARGALMTPVKENGEEDWNKLKVIKADSDEDEIADGFMISDTGRVNVL